MTAHYHEMLRRIHAQTLANKLAWANPTGSVFSASAGDMVIMVRQEKRSSELRGILGMLAVASSEDFSRTVYVLTVRESRDDATQDVRPDIVLDPDKWLRRESAALVEEIWHTVADRIIAPVRAVERATAALEALDEDHRSLVDSNHSAESGGEE